MIKKKSINKIVLIAASVVGLGALPSGAIAQDAYIGEIKWVANDFFPRNWAVADGSSMLIANQAPLFSLIGTRYGGDGRKTFALPDLRGRVMVGAGNGPGSRLVGLGIGRAVRWLN